MEKKKIVFLQTAQEKLHAANQELYKPEEDVVTYLVCKNAQFAIESYLKGYLMHHGISTMENETLQKLLNRCVELDPKFTNIDFSTIDCKSKDLNSGYCSDVSKVSSCFDTADSIDTLLKQLKII